MSPTSVRRNRTSPLMGLPGAVADDSGFDAGLAWHYGDPLGEQRAAERGPIVIDGWNADMLAVTGDERLSWLHTLTSQHVADMEQGAAAGCLWLSAQGRIEHWADATYLNDTVFLRTEPGCAEPLAEFLRSMKFWSAVDIADRSDDFALLTVAGTGRGAAIEEGLDVPNPPAGHATILTSGAGSGGWVRAHADRTDVVVPRAAVGAVYTELSRVGAPAAGTWAAAALRVAARRPRFGLDNDDRTIPNETPWLADAVHLNKGCYRGQETVARIDNLGAPPRRLVLLSLDGSGETLPSPGDAVTTAAGRTVGRLGTVAQHWIDGPIALALVKRTVGPDDALAAGGVDARIDPDDQPIRTRAASVDRAAFPRFERRR